MEYLPCVEWTLKGNYSSQIGSLEEGVGGCCGANSAVSEEVSATSEELTAQAASLDEMVAQFKLKE